MKFRFIKKVAGEVNAYGVHGVKTGDIIELDEALSAKAVNNPNYQLVKRVRRKKADAELSGDEGGRRSTVEDEVKNGDES